MKPVVDKDGNVVRLPNHKIKYDYDYKKDENGNIAQRYALNAKAIFGNRRKMSEEQTRFYEACGKSLGMERGECRIDDTEEDIVRHMSEVEYKAHARASEKAKDIIDTASKDAQAKRMEANSKIKEANQQAKAQNAIFEARKKDLSNMLKEASSLLEDIKAVKPEDESFKDFLMKNPSYSYSIKKEWERFVESKNETPEQKERKRRLQELRFRFNGNFIDIDNQDSEPEYY